MTTPKYTTTCVSGFWPVVNKHGINYFEWFKNSLKINCPYVFFADGETIPIIQKCRGDLPTVYVKCSIDEFETYKYRHRIRTHPVHCPSIELNLIWNEKMFLMRKALALNPFDSDFFVWVDAGICTYRTNPPPASPFPNVEKVAGLPTLQFIYTSSKEYVDSAVQRNKYYHHVSGTFMMHKSFLPDFVRLYETYLDHLVDKRNVWTEQVLLTHIYKDYPHLFYKLADGFGELFPSLY